MAPTRPRKQASTESSASQKKHATSSGSDSPSTPQRTPIRKKQTGITLQQKQALIENLRLEITERARRLRAQYHLQAQGLRSRIEIRLNRIPTALRKATMGDLLLKYADQAQGGPNRPLPQPVKDLPILPSPQKPIHQTTRAPQVGRAQKRLSDDITMDKENELQKGERPKKKARGEDTGLVHPAQVLSPTSSNSRLANRSRATSPTKSYLYKSNSPLKAGSPTRLPAATNLGTRTGGLRKVTTTSNSSSSSSGATPAAAARTKRTATAVPAGLRTKLGARTTRKASDNTESSDGSANTVLRKTAGKGNSAIARKPVPGSAKKPASGGIVKSTAKVATTVSTTATGRTLRKRG
ncbi:Nbl1_Borealin_N domain-containing protein [Trichoderma simmonsii]|uniref:Nbl1_Borealin_N domain-containing protein n=1 Tax=Trichoderma simmonsii TaxID=1491479 RepID=A0A8G0LEA4_9HYPO|nr:Nbl1_Borealin_N domain-containing protein [Trichoderma simmonsii]